MCLCQWRSKDSRECRSSGAVRISLLRQSFFMDLEFPKSDRLPDQQGLEIHLYPHTKNWDYSVHYRANLFLCGFWGPNTNPHAFKASILPSELFPYSLHLILFIPVLICVYVSVLYLYLDPISSLICSRRPPTFQPFKQKPKAL